MRWRVGSKGDLVSRFAAVRVRPSHRDYWRAEPRPDDAPALLLHGGKDTLVPDKHSREIVRAFKEKGVITDLVMFPAAAHGFGGEDATKAATAMVEWFEKHLVRPAPNTGQ